MNDDGGAAADAAPPSGAPETIGDVLAKPISEQPETLIGERTVEIDFKPELHGLINAGSTLMLFGRACQVLRVDVRTRDGATKLRLTVRETRHMRYGIEQPMPMGDPAGKWNCEGCGIYIGVDAGARCADCLLKAAGVEAVDVADLGPDRHAKPKPPVHPNCKTTIGALDFGHTVKAVQLNITGGVSELNKAFAKGAEAIAELGKSLASVAPSLSPEAIVRAEVHDAARAGRAAQTKILADLRAGRISNATALERLAETFGAPDDDGPALPAPGGPRRLIILDDDE